MNENKAALIIKLGDEALARLVASAAEQAAAIVLDQIDRSESRRRWLSLRETADYTGIPHGTLQKLASARKLPGAVKQGKRWLVDRLALDDWLQNGAVPNRPPRRT